MRDRSAALVDVMSFLFLFATVVFVVSTDGAREPPAQPQRFLSVNVTAVTSNADYFRLECSDTGAAIEDAGFTLSVYLRVAGETLQPAAKVAESCFPATSANTETAHMRILLDLGEKPDALLIFVSRMGRAESLGDNLSLDIEAYGNDFCAQQSYDLTFGTAFPMLLQSSGSCA